MYWSSQRVSIISSLEVPLREHRLDPTRYNERAERIVRHFKERGIATIRIGQWDGVSRVFVAPRFKRPYVNVLDEGVPFLGSSSMLALRLPKDYLLAKSFPKLPSLMLHGGEVLLSCSGTIGVSVLCGDSYRGYALSQHAARIYASEDVRGYLHAFFSSDLGRELVLQQNYGKVIKELTEDQIRNVAAPILPPDAMAEINRLMLDAATKLDIARRLLETVELEVRSSVEQLCKKNTLGVWASKAEKCFLTASDGLFNYRLDPHFHHPDILSLRNTVRSGANIGLGEIADVWMPSRFARPTAEIGHGVSLYTSADMMRARRLPGGTIAQKAKKHIDQCRVRSRMVLICRSGAYGGIMGRATLVSPAADGWAVTEDMVRCMVTSDEYSPEYVFALLSSLGIGYPLITAFRYGKDVPHIDPDELKTILIPVLPATTRTSLTKKVQDAYSAVDAANDMEAKAVKKLLSEVGWEPQGP